MKLSVQISTILLSLLFVYALNFKSIITLHYFINQAEITELFCINKEKPKLNCKGKCHLTKKLVKVDDEKSENPISNRALQLNFEITTILPEHHLLNTKLFKNSRITYYCYHDETIEQFYTSEFPPPKS
ncbi:MAG: hypothetical protein KF732_12355 [Flavobacteriales bacterium]|nr:hypothetical protein [Flavobacteriales bacterium]